ncbi:hypothetical protein GGS23DRAFT_41509 [Durotheca rogersii]|uniref:uncharacterized protein n=1 Tax=Durotheca rogersii TaxID=419775 RepID=UPI00222073B9|nr:uncharacterized protein GGS23DRAFT_41509 [Durotheca rogersii]KAI5868640.1 hypothetical protein GGS23DRAFT_41509 [Durotheca rogersii]
MPWLLLKPSAMAGASPIFSRHLSRRGCTLLGTSSLLTSATGAPIYRLLLLPFLQLVLRQNKTFSPAFVAREIAPRACSRTTRSSRDLRDTILNSSKHETTDACHMALLGQQDGTTCGFWSGILPHCILERLIELTLRIRDEGSLDPAETP